MGDNFQDNSGDLYIKVKGKGLLGGSESLLIEPSEQRAEHSATGHILQPQWDPKNGIHMVANDRFNSYIETKYEVEKISGVSFIWKEPTTNANSGIRVARFDLRPLWLPAAEQEGKTLSFCYNGDPVLPNKEASTRMCSEFSTVLFY